MGDHHQQLHGMNVGGDDLNFPPGFRFHPSDEEIITFYLTPKVIQSSFNCIPIGEVDLNKIEPWDLPGKAKMMGEKEWYFFYQKDRKYPTGMRANRATVGGYWKATGKDKEIYRATPGVGMMPLLVGMKKTLVFYTGRAPRGEKTSWVMHEYRLDGSGRIPCPTSSSTSNNANMTSASKDQWVVCRVFHKTLGIKKGTALSYTMDMADCGEIDHSIPMPIPMQFPILPDFTVDPVAPYYSTAGTSSSLMPPLMPPMLGMGNTLFENLMGVAPSMPFCHQIGMGAAGTSSFMALPESRSPSMVSQKDAMLSLNKANATKIPSMVSNAPLTAATMDMDGIWKY